MIDKIAEISARTGHSEGCIDYAVETLQDAGHPDWDEAISLVEEAFAVGDVRCYCPAEDATEARTFAAWERFPASEERPMTDQLDECPECGSTSSAQRNLVCGHLCEDEFHERADASESTENCCEHRAEQHYSDGSCSQYRCHREPAQRDDTSSSVSETPSEGAGWRPVLDDPDTRAERREARQP